MKLISTFRGINLYYKREKKMASSQSGSQSSWGHDLSRIIPKLFSTQLLEPVDKSLIENLVSSQKCNEYNTFIQDAETILKDYKDQLKELENSEMFLLQNRINFMQTEQTDLASKTESNSARKTSNSATKTANSATKTSNSDAIQPVTRHATFTVIQTDKEKENTINLILMENIFVMNDKKTAYSKKWGLNTMFIQPPKICEDKDNKELITKMHKIDTDQLKNHLLHVNFHKKDNVVKNKNKNITLQADPPEVSFFGFTPGKSFNFDILLKNICSKSLKCHIYAPESRNFFLLEGIYPCANHSIAPGLSCKLKVSFEPGYSLQYEDSIEVIPSEGDIITIPLEAKRQRAMLSFPRIWKCGQCFLGDKVELKITAVNKWELSGKVVITSPEEDCEMIHTEYSHGVPLLTTLHLDAFTVVPSVFKIKSSEKSKEFTIIYEPNVQGFNEKKILVTYETKDTGVYIIQGTCLVANVGLVTCKGYWNYPEIFEAQDLYARYFMRFDNLYCHESHSKTFTVTNNTGICLSYTWQIVRPRLNVTEEVTGTQNETINLVPLQGAIKGFAKQTFNVQYRPKQIGVDHVALCFVLRNIPKLSAKHLQEWQILELTPRHKDHVSICLFEIDVKGECLPLELCISPMRVEILTPLETGETHRHPFQIFNRSATSVFYRWQALAKAHIITVVPALGYIGPMDSANSTLNITGVETGTFEEIVYCKVQYEKDPLQLPIRFHVKTKDVVIEESHLTLDVIPLNSQVETSITLRNKASAYCKWSIELSVSETIRIEVKPYKGTIDPLGREAITVIVEGIKAGPISSTITLLVSEHAQCHIPIYGEVVEPKVCLLRCTYHAPTVIRCHPFKTSVTLHNQTPIETSFHWSEPEGVDAKSCSLVFNPVSDKLYPNEKKVIEITCTVNDLVTLHDVCVPCWVNGLDHPLYWSLSGDVVLSDIVCYIPDDRTQRIVFDEKGDETRSVSRAISLDLCSGKIADLGETVNRQLMLKNTGAVEVNFTINYKNEEVIYSTKSNQQLSKRMICGTLNDNLSVKNKGLSIIFNPPSGTVKPFANTVIDIYAKSDMWGAYNETFELMVGRFHPVPLNLSFTSVGIPLTFRAANPGGIQIVRFGKLQCGDQPKKRVVEVLNLGPVDILVDFSTYTVSDDDEKKLIDYTLVMADEEMNGDEEATDKLLKVIMTPHEGTLDNTYFSVSPKQIVVPGRKSAKTEISFHPPQVCDDKQQLNGYAKGIVSLYLKDRKGKNYDRQHRYNIQTVRFYYHAEICP